MPDAATQAMLGLTASGTSAASMVAGATAVLGVLALAKSCVSDTAELTTAESDSLAAWQAQKALGALPPDAVAAQQSKLWPKNHLSDAKYGMTIANSVPRGVRQDASVSVVCFPIRLHYIYTYTATADSIHQ